MEARWRRCESEGMREGTLRLTNWPEPQGPAVSSPPANGLLNGWEAALLRNYQIGDLKITAP
jgi:hypothetical protein